MSFVRDKRYKKDKLNLVLHCLSSFLSFLQGYVLGMFWLFLIVHAIHNISSLSRSQAHELGRTTRGDATRVGSVSSQEMVSPTLASFPRSLHYPFEKNKGRLVVNSLLRRITSRSILFFYISYQMTVVKYIPQRFI